MSLTNQEIRQQLAELVATCQAADQALAGSDDLPPLELATVAVELGKLGAKAVKVADRIGQLSAPLFGANGAGDGQEIDRPPGRKRRE